MDIRIEDRNGVKVLRLHGEFVGGPECEFVDTVTNLLAGPGTRVVLDFHEVPFMNSTGLGELVRVAAQANIQECRLILANLSAFVAGVLQTTQLDRFFEVCPTVDEAIVKP